MSERLALEFCGLRLSSPVVLLSGCVGFGEEYTRVEGFSNRDVGAIVLKGTTYEPRLGNPAHRVWETPSLTQALHNVFLVCGSSQLPETWRMFSKRW